ncbi:hypothetical protein BCV70DRAFT_71658 [Testicularia cyperi]|uniref:Uncharacterized protein n=1 Tax=Testicularia cyperi TaxID=1882483 RepID=A0A317XSL1_9BASI|nr:hypothetical protein BCV70DRAFT_71658 [Testicularia cyperi]
MDLQYSPTRFFGQPARSLAVRTKYSWCLGACEILSSCVASLIQMCYTRAGKEGCSLRKMSTNLSANWSPPRLCKRTQNRVSEPDEHLDLDLDLQLRLSGNHLRLFGSPIAGWCDRVFASRSFSLLLSGPGAQAPLPQSHARARRRFHHVPTLILKSLDNRFRTHNSNVGCSVWLYSVFAGQATAVALPLKTSCLHSPSCGSAQTVQARRPVGQSGSAQYVLGALSGLLVRALTLDAPGDGLMAPTPSNCVWCDQQSFCMCVDASQSRRRREAQKRVRA